MSSRSKCVVCGYVHSKDDDIDKCPICGAGKEKWISLPELPDLPADIDLPKVLPKVVNITHPDCAIHELQIGRIKADIIRIASDGNPMTFSYNSSSVLIVIEGSGSLTCEDGFDPDSFLGFESDENDVETPSGEEKPLDTDTEEKIHENIEEQNDIETDSDIPPEENREEPEKPIDEDIDTDENKISGNASDLPEKVNILSGMIILLPANISISMQSDTDNPLTILHIR